MPASSRAGGRDVHLFSKQDPNTKVGGLVLTYGITNANLHAMIKILIIFHGEYTLLRESGTKVEKDDSPLEPGNYYIDSSDPFDINNETTLVRTFYSSQTGQRIQSFHAEVRARDRRCVVTGKPVLGHQHNMWVGFEAAHIFPLAYEEHWRNNDFGRWISRPPAVGGSINSVQNGILLACNVHQLFDVYNFSINPDDGHKIVHFGFDSEGIAGKHLDEEFLTDPQRPPDELFRWHFRQAVLINMRGAGEPVFEHDFPPGSDIMGSILEGPHAARRIEAELHGRLGAHFELT